MRYLSPRIRSVRMNDVLAQLGPARALLYVPGGDPVSSKSGGGSGTGSGGGSRSGSGSKSGSGSGSGS